MKCLAIVLPLAFIFLNTVVNGGAQDQNMPPPPPPMGEERPALTDMTVTGTVSKVDTQAPDGATVSRYVLTDNTGSTIMLPGKPMGPGNEQAVAVDVEGYANQKVTIIGKGFQTEREGNKITHLVIITTINVVTTSAKAQ